MDNELKVGDLFRLKRALDRFFPMPNTDEQVKVAYDELRIACAQILDTELAPA